MSRLALTGVSLLVGALFILPVLPVGAVDYDTPERHLLQFKVGAFDPLTDALPFPDGFTLSESQGYYIIQYDGIIESTWRTALDGLATVLLYQPDNAYVVRADADVVSLLKNLDHVRYIGNFEPGFKIHPLLEFTGTPRTIQVVTFPGADSIEVAGQLTFLGASLQWIDPLIVRIVAPGYLAERIAFLPEVQWIEDYHPPEIYNGPASKTSKIRQNSDGPYTGGASALWSWNTTGQKFDGYAGSGFVAAVADTGVDGTHPAFNNKKVAFYNYAGGAQWVDLNIGHGTHTSGTVLGNGAWRASDPGTLGQYAGMAPLAGLVGQAIFGGGGSYYNFCNDAVKNNATVSSNSWGSSNWGEYDSSAYSYDSLVRDSDNNKAGNQSLSVVFAVGNDGTSGANTIGPPATAKNVISVGATDNSGGGSIAGFSSRGPTDDGRIKPDIVTPGWTVTSCRANSAGSYTAAQGTSMACPVVAGAVVIVNEYYNRTYGKLPSPSMVKDLLVNGADPMNGYTYPGNDAGFGRLNLGKALVNTSARKIWVEDEVNCISTGMGRNYNFNITAAGELKVSLVWTDKPGNVNSNPSLVNNMDLIVQSPGGLTTYFGNNFVSGYSSSGGNADNRNTVEMARFNNPATGKWSVNVKATNVPQGPQDYSLVIAGPFDDVEVDIVDLAAQNLSLSSFNPAEGELVTLSGNITNSGTLPLSNVRYRFKLTAPNNITTIVANTLFADAMNPGNRTFVTAGWIAVRGSYAVMLEADPFSIIPENREDNNNVTLPLSVRGYGIDLQSAPNTTYTNPGLKASVNVTVFNRGNAYDTYALTMDGTVPPDWQVSVDTTSCDLLQGQNLTFKVSFTPPAGARAFDRAGVRIRAVSAGNSSYAMSVNVSAVINQLFKLSLATNSTEKWVEPGMVVTYPIHILNGGNGQDSCTLSVSGEPAGWKASLSSSYLILQGGTEHITTLSVAAPAAAAALSNAEVKVACSSGNSARTTLSTTTRVQKITLFELVLANGPDAVDAGQTVEYVVRLKNRGNYNESYTLQDDGPEDWSGAFDNLQPKVNLGDFSLITYTLQIPSKTLAGEHWLNITAIPDGNQTAGVTLIIPVKVNQFHGVKILTTDTKDTFESGNGTEFEFTVVNTGNGVDTFSVFIDSSPSSAWRVYTNTSELKLGPGESALVLLRIKSSAMTSEGDYSVLVKSASTGNPLRTVTGQFKVTVTKPPEPPVIIPPPPPPPPPDPDPITPVVDNSAMSVLKRNWFIVVGLLILLVTGVAVAMASRSRKKDDRSLRPPEPAGQFYAEETTPAYAQMESCPAYEPASCTPAYAPSQSADTVPIQWSEPSDGPQTPPAPEPTRAPLPEHSPVIAPETIRAPEPVPTIEPVSVPQTAPPIPECEVLASPPATLPEKAVEKNLDNDIADILSRLNSLSK